MDLGLAGKRALVTGSTKGIGRAIAETLLAEGASVAICARSADDVEAAVAELSDSGTVVGGVVDAADLDSLEAWIASSAEQLGGIDIYVHNTSGKPQQGARRLVEELRHRPEGAGRGRGGRRGRPRRRRRVAHQHRHHRHRRALRLGLGQLQRVQGRRHQLDARPGPGARSPGHPLQRRVARTDLRRGRRLGHDQGRHARRSTRPPRRPTRCGHIGTTQDVANAVAFLVSDAAKHVNGVNLTVDGGFLKRVDY